MPNSTQTFLSWLDTWIKNLPTAALEDITSPPGQTAIVSSDLLKGFCTEGPLASPRIAGIVSNAVDIFEHAHELGVPHYLLLEDAHEPEAVEFEAYPPHCMEGTKESETIDELKNLPFSDQFTILPKNSTSATNGTDLIPWLEDHPEVTTFVIVGDCTDICVYQAAIELRVRANVLGQEEARVVVPADCVQTYDMPVEAAQEVGALPHEGDLLNRIFLYHMALNGIEVFASLT
jgi:nicotinamidase-related amidase